MILRNSHSKKQADGLQEVATLSSYQVNWKMLDEIIDFVKCELLNFYLTDNMSRHNVIDNLGLITVSNPPTNELQNHFHDARNVWSCDSNQSLFILMSAMPSAQPIHTPLFTHYQLQHSSKRHQLSDQQSS